MSVNEEQYSLQEPNSPCITIEIQENIEHPVQKTVTKLSSLFTSGELNFFIRAIITALGCLSFIFLAIEPFYRIDFLNITFAGIYLASNGLAWFFDLKLQSTVKFIGKTSIMNILNFIDLIMIFLGCVMGKNWILRNIVNKEV